MVSLRAMPAALALAIRTEGGKCLEGRAKMRSKADRVQALMAAIKLLISAWLA